MTQEVVGCREPRGSGLYNMWLTDERIVRCKDCKYGHQHDCKRYPKDKEVHGPVVLHCVGRRHAGRVDEGRWVLPSGKAEGGRMTDEQRQRIHDIEYSCDSREELAERIVVLEDKLTMYENDHQIATHIHGSWKRLKAENPKLREENAKLRELCIDFASMLTYAGLDGLRVEATISGVTKTYDASELCDKVEEIWDKED